ncbi:hypothetical protein [Nonomuraea sp. B19D2]|uniref:hypothetical protein n=1 Tax=Nonomuraea sp. B19D2 TaxID=3159561 RepID=UPI0032DAC8A4
MIACRKGSAAPETCAPTRGGGACRRQGRTEALVELGDALRWPRKENHGATFREHGMRHYFAGLLLTEGRMRRVIGRASAADDPQTAQEIDL